MICNLELIWTRKFWILLFLVLQCGGVITQTPYGPYFECINLLLCILEHKKGYIYSRKLLSFWIIFSFLVFISIFYTESWLVLTKYLFIIARAFLAVVVIAIFKNDLNKLEDYLYEVLWFICYIELLNFLLSNLAPFLFYTYNSTSTIGYSLQTIGFIFNYMIPYEVKFWGIISFFRNQGLFWEPGVCQFTMNILLYMMLIEKRKSLKKALLPIIVILSTMSTTGYVISLIIIVIRFRSNFRRMAQLHKVFVIIAIIAALFVVFQNVTNKIVGDGKESAVLRFYDYTMGLSIISSNPIFGIGYDTQKYIDQSEIIDLDFFDEYEDIGADGRGNTNSIISVFMFFGIPIGILYIYYLYMQTLVSGRKTYFVVLLLSLLSEPLYLSTFIFLHIFSSVIERNVRGEHENQYFF